MTINADLRGGLLEELRRRMRAMEWLDRPGDCDHGQCPACNGNRFALVEVMPGSAGAYVLVAGEHDAWCEVKDMLAIVNALCVPMTVGTS